MDQPVRANPSHSTPASNMAIGRPFLIVASVLFAILLLWRILPPAGNAGADCEAGAPCGPVAWAWVQETPIDTAVARWGSRGAPIWTVHPTDGGMIAIADVSIRTGCRIHVHEPTVDGRTVHIQTRETDGPAVRCAWEATHYTQWAEHFLPLPTGLWTVIWERPDEPADTVEIAVAR